ncbi:MAG TPA: hypothetical protein DCQ37_22065 [Desulfobacteraceae bacterium]|nr:hypothetical protein [Desulfobacteraceae bacterium]
MGGRYEPKTKTHSDSDKRIPDQIAVINIFPDSPQAMKSYSSLHKESPERELYVLHTAREELDISERNWLGIRGIR